MYKYTAQISGKPQHNVKILREKVWKEAGDVELVSHNVQWKHSSKVIERRQEKKEKRQKKIKRHGSLVITYAILTRNPC